MKVPQPFPYQGSKRALAAMILPYVPNDCATFIEPFAGSAAMSISTAARKLAKRFVINDINKPLANLWSEIIDDPESLAKRYARIWHEQHGRENDYFKEVRMEFNKTHQPDQFLFLLARCCKAAIRYNQKGEFNQAADPRRKGMIPSTMRGNLLATSALLKGKSSVCCMDYAELCLTAKVKDVIYMDPPYQGVCKDRDSRYSSTLAYDHFVAAVRHDRRSVSIHGRIIYNVAHRLEKFVRREWLAQHARDRLVLPILPISFAADDEDRNVCRLSISTQ